MHPHVLVDDAPIAIEQGSNNPYADLGRPDADEMLVKAELAHQIAQILKSRHLTQQRAAELLGMPQPKLSEMLRGKFRGISQAKMMECLNRLGRDVEIVVKKTGRRSLGHTTVMVA
ncbi:MAG: helix-turn-helix domain-containing protein [Rhodoferax sp.]